MKARRDDRPDKVVSEMIFMMKYATAVVLLAIAFALAADFFSG
jgi:hypothetical protein